MRCNSFRNYFNNSKKIAEYQMKIIELAQHVTLLEAKNNKKKEKE